MFFEFEQVDELPRLAWCARLRAGEALVSVRHGPWVETSEDAFFEGAWDGDVEEGRFDTALTFAGTGARLLGDGVLFSAPTNFIERLYSVRIDDSLWVSNSMVFLLVQAGDGLDPAYPHYYGDILGHYQAGLLRKIKTLPTRLGNRVRLHDYRNVLVRPDLSMQDQSKILTEAPGNFREYTELLLRSIDSVLKNASDPARRRTYRPLSTVSSGYDSTAVLALGRQCGCEEAFTFSTVGGIPTDDSGLPIADALGVKCSEHDLLEYRNLPGLPEAEFCASCPPGYNVTFAPLGSLLESRILLTGFNARCWYIDSIERPGRARGWRTFIGGDSLTDFRLRVGFHTLPVPPAGGVPPQALIRISNTEEMRPWSLKAREYNRPIPRRIAEEAGVPRELFGMSKRAGGHVWLNKAGMMTDGSKKDFSAFCGPSVQRPGRVRYRIWQVMTRLFELNIRLNEQLCRRFHGNLPTFMVLPIIPARYGCLPKQYPYLLQWGFERIKSRYDHVHGLIKSNQFNE